MAARVGFEPTIAAPKAAALPLGHRALIISTRKLYANTGKNSIKRMADGYPSALRLRCLDTARGG